jgi:Ca2+/Na+ antiporter
LLLVVFLLLFLLLVLVLELVLLMLVLLMLVLLMLVLLMLVLLMLVLLVLRTNYSTMLEHHHASSHPHLPHSPPACFSRPCSKCRPSARWLCPKGGCLLGWLFVQPRQYEREKTGRCPPRCTSSGGVLG